MIGRELQGDYYRSDFKATSQPQVALDVKNLIYGDRLKDISFQVKKRRNSRNRRSGALWNAFTWKSVFRSVKA